MIKKFPHVLLFDKDNKQHPVINLPDNIETILTNSPVAMKIDGETKLVGFVSYASNRSGTGLFYGDVELSEGNCDFTNITVVFNDITPSKENPHIIVGIVTYIEKSQI